MVTNTLTALRDMMPPRALTIPEALRIAELQAAKLLALSSVTEPPIPERIITELPWLQIERVKLAGISGAAQWTHGRWLIVLNGSDIPTRQRFSLAHEFKHVLDNPFIAMLYPPAHGQSATERAEQVCDYFAGCLLMPRLWLEQAWNCDKQDVRRLASTFNVSQAAIRVRLTQIGLTGPSIRDPLPPGS